MKANKVRKRLAKIEALISDLTERFSKGALPIREALQNAKAAIAHVKQAVSLQASSGTVKRAPLKRKKAAVKKAAAKAAIAKTGKKSVPIKKAAKKAAVKKTAPALVQVATKSAAQVPIGK
jgi:hypothetical protein